MIRTTSRCATGALVFSLVAALSTVSGCGGGGGSTAVQISITNLNPTTSADLNGGETITITGSSFDAFIQIQVFFGAEQATNRTPISPSEFTVRLPPAPGGVPGPVDVRIVGTDAEGEQFQDILAQAFTYVGPPQDPDPQTITRTTFSPTGAEEFFINGSDLGTPGATQVVEFEGIGRVSVIVSNDATSLQGNAPITGALSGPQGNIRVVVDPDGAAAELPTRVTYNAFPVSTVPGVNFMEGMGEASLPRRLADGFAALCTAGPNGTWGDMDDEIWVVSGQPGGPGNFGAIPARFNNAPVGYLNRRNSIPAVLDGDTFCVYSIGPDGTANTGDDRVLLVTAARTNPGVTAHNFPNINTAPLGAIPPNRVAFLFGGDDAILANGNDRLFVVEFSGTSVAQTFTSTFTDSADTTAGAGNLSIPWTTDGDSVYAIGSGNDGTAGNGDDMIVRLRLSDGVEATTQAAHLIARPQAVSGSVSASVTTGNGTLGDAADRLIVFQDTGNSINVVQHAINGSNAGASPVPFAPFGNGGVAVPSLGPDFAPGNGTEDILVFTDPVAGTTQTLNGRGPVVLAPLRTADRSLVLFNRGNDNTAATGDEIVRSLDGTSLLVRSFTNVPLWDQMFGPLGDESRVFAIGPGPDAAPNTGDEVLIVHQTRSLGQPVDAVTIGAGGRRLQNTLPFVPVGVSWGLVPSPGTDGTFRTADDVLLVIEY